MDADAVLERATAARYASWFQALADPTRLQVVALLAGAGRPSASTGLLPDDPDHHVPPIVRHGVGGAQMSPSRIAYATACDRLRSCRRVVISCTTFFTVRSE